MANIPNKPPGIEFFFQSFSALEYKENTPVLCVVFESQPDVILSNEFPEVEKMREMFDRVRDRGDETVSIFGGQRDDTTIPLGTIYIRRPWRRRRKQAVWDIDSINFYCELRERTILATNRVRGSGYTEFVIVLPSRFRSENLKNDKQQEQRLQKFVRSITEAVVYANHSLDEFVSDAPPLIKSVTLIYFGEEDRNVNNFFQRSIAEGRAIGEATGYVRQLTLLPANFKSPLQFVSRSTGMTLKPKTSRSKSWRFIKGHSFSSNTKISYLYGKEGIEQFGLGLIHAVGKGSMHHPMFLKIHYRPPTERQKSVRKVVLIGKGIVFDTGGTNAKDALGLKKMHYDMSGAAVVVGVMKLAETTSLPVELIALVPLAENANGPESTRPEDVVKAYNGTTVEITDTDAEGRLVIADAVAYSERHLKPDCTITIGTLSTMSDFAPDILKVGFGSNKLCKKIWRAENDSTEKVLLLPSIEHLNKVDDEHLGEKSDLLNWPAGNYYHVSPFVFIYNFLAYEKPEWVFVDPSVLFEPDADNDGAGPGFGLKFIWYLVKQYA